jgi:hypothetical protein
MTSSANDSAHHGQHLCLPFETDEEKQAAIVSFFHEGLARGNRCVFVGTATEFEDLGRRLDVEGVSISRAQARGALRFLTQEEAYLHDGVFDPTRVLARVAAQIDEALADGFTGLRGTGELRYVPAAAEWQKIVWYEAQVNEYFARRPFAGLCRYPRAVVPAERVCDVLRTHPVAVVRGEVCDNPFYERPALALSDDGEARLDWQLRQLRIQNRLQRHLEGKAASAVAAAVELAAELAALRARFRPARLD